MAYRVSKVELYNFHALFNVARILKECGEDMYAKYGLAHWRNSYFKTLLIIFYTALKNSVYACFDEDSTMIATFQTKRREGILYFSKLAVLPALSGNGIGSFCLNQIEKMAADENVPFVRCEVYDRSEHAYNFYISHGYKKAGSVSTLKYNELILEKELIREQV